MAEPQQSNEVAQHRRQLSSWHLAALVCKLSLAVLMRRGTGTHLLLLLVVLLLLLLLLLPVAAFCQGAEAGVAAGLLPTAQPRCVQRPMRQPVHVRCRCRPA